MRKTRLVAAILAALGLTASLVSVSAQVSVPQPKVAPKVSTVPQARVAVPAATVIQRSFQSVVARQNWTPATKQKVLDAFSKLPAGMQEAVAEAWDAPLATRQGLAAVSLTREALQPRVPVHLPYISRVWPASGDGSPNSWLLVYGMGINSNCQIWFDGRARATSYMPWGEDWGQCVGCQIPTVALAREYDLYVADTAANRTSNHLNYRVVAPRHWRGLHGWKFANFRETTIPWEVYRHYFGADEVEDGSGRHLPAAQAWYDSAYQRVGSGGNCFGMTLRAVRTLFWQPWSLYESWWNANRLARAWDYEFVNEVQRSVNEDQGAQLEASVMANKLWLLENQDHNQAWERCRDLIGQLTSRNNPVLSIYGPGWGHCVWPYRTEEAGNERRIYIYDNNVPYVENETSDSTMVVRINKTTGALTWGSATRTICRSYADCTPANPHLPSEATEGEAASMVTIVLDRPARATQITDEAGRTFYVNGRINTDSRTRIPMSLLFIPDTGTTPAPDFPALYVFGRARDKSLRVEAVGAQGRTISAFAPRLVFQVRCGADQADLTLNRLVSAQASLLANNVGAGEIRCIMCTGARQQRVIGVRLLDAARGVLFAPNADRSGLSIENRSGAALRYELEINSFQAGGLISARLPTQTLAAQTGALLAPTNWAQLREIGLELRNLTTGATIRRELLGPEP